MSGLEWSGDGVPSVTIATACPACDRALEMALEMTPSSDHVVPVRFVCPWCGEGSVFESARRILSVARDPESDADPSQV